MYMFNCSPLPLQASNEVDSQQRESVARNLRAQITSLHDRLRRVGETEATLSARVASQDRKMARLEGKILSNSIGNTSGGGGSAHHAASSHRKVNLQVGRVLICLSQSRLSQNRAKVYFAY